MRIGIDARPLTGTLTGIGHYLVEMLRALAEADPVHEFILYAHRPIAFSPPGPRWRTRVHQGMRGTGPIWLQLHGSRLAREDGIDIFWGAHFLLPLVLPRRIRAVMTVYDLVPFLYPQTMEFTNYLVIRLLLPPSLARADHVAVISHTGAADLQRLFRLTPDRITVVPPGVARRFHPLERADARARVAQAFGIGQPYLLAVGTLEPRKNLITLVRAVAALPRSVRSRAVVAIVGASGWKTSALRAAAAPLVREGAIRFLGYVAEADLPSLYAGATALLFPSLYEGFGIPVIEAMASGTPVVASDIPVLREVAGDAACFVPVVDPAGWANAVVRLLDDAALRATLVERGLHRAGQFTFDASARRMLDLWDRLVP